MANNYFHAYADDVLAFNPFFFADRFIKIYLFASSRRFFSHASFSVPEMSFCDHAAHYLALLPRYACLSRDNPPIF